ncbi:HEPN domain-containing protein [Amycolatopsis sp. NPDC051373]|uniref:HEPN domain-containing protein n=1 Tax=Amycolatopsis sp. NPDC051373 TaxID=3155801 RepID=UPI00344BD2EE
MIGHVLQRYDPRATRITSSSDRFEWRRYTLHKLEVNQPFDLYGLFWLQGQSTDRSPGRIFRTPDDGVQIQLFRDLRPRLNSRQGDSSAEWVTEDPLASTDNTPITVEGILGDQNGSVVAIECITVHEQYNIFEDRPREYRLAPKYVMFNVRESTNCQQFTGVRLRTRDLDQWADLIGFSRVNGEGSIGISLKLPDIPDIPLVNGSSLTFEQSMVRRGPTSTGGSIERKVWAQVDHLSNLCWQEVDVNVIAPITTLISLCTGTSNDVIDVEVRNDENGWMPICSNYFVHAEPELRRGDAFLSFRQVGLASIGTWLNTVDRLGPLPPVVARFASRGARVNLETELLEMTTVAEGLHARLYPDQVRLDQETCSAVEAAVRAAVDHMGDQVKNIVRGKLSHLEEPGYTLRLKTLAKRLERVAPAIYGKPNKWAEEVSTIRNGYAHRTGGFLDSDAIDGLITILESLRWLLRCVLLLEAGISEETLSDSIARSAEFSFFMHRSKLAFPHVYINQ